MLFPDETSSVPDLMDEIRDQLSARLDHLRPLVDEHGRLQAAMRALGDAQSEPAVASPPVKTTKSRGRKPPPAKRRKRAPRGANREAVLRAASQRPGATRRELADDSGVEPNTLSALLARLVKAGELQTHELPTGRTGYTPTDAPPAQPAGAGSTVGPDSADSSEDRPPAAPAT
jgi:CRP-like cAMP-binding protein